MASGTNEGRSIMKWIFLLAVGGYALSALGTITDYNDLIHMTIEACKQPNQFLHANYTNDVMNYRCGCTNAQSRSAADLSLALCLMYRMDHDSKCVGNATCYEWHQSLVSNVLFSAELDQRSWVRYAAGAEYVMGLNYGNHPLEGFVVSTNMLAQLAVNPVDMGSTNFWDGMMCLYESQGCSPQTGFLLNAALVLAEQKRWEEVIPYTNSLPSFAIEIFLENITP